MSFKIKKNNENISNGNYSISARKINEFKLSKKSEKSKLTLKNSINQDFIIPEFRGEIIAGSIKSKTGKSIENKNVSLSIPGKNYVFEITKTNQKGQFVFNLENQNTNSNIIIQAIDSDKDDFKIELTEEKSPSYNALVFDDFQINIAATKNIELKSIANQIENAFYQTKKDSILPEKDLTSFYKKTATEFILDNYTRFPTLKETIIEVIEGLYFEKKNKNYTLLIRDFDLNNKLEIPALVIVDGLLIQDVNELLDHKADLFFKIDIIKGGYYYGTKLFNGLISFTTKEYNYESKINGDFIIKPNILRPVARKEYFQPNYSVNNSLDRIPDYRQQLLWLPNVSLEKEQKFSFFTSDITGQFEIILEGFTDTGIPVYETEIIEVK